MIDKNRENIGSLICSKYAKFIHNQEMTVKCVHVKGNFGSEMNKML
jgi:hypothetical protein